MNILHLFSDENRHQNHPRVPGRSLALVFPQTPCWLIADDENYLRNTAYHRACRDSSVAGNYFPCLDNRTTNSYKASSPEMSIIRQKNCLWILFSVHFPFFIPIPIVNRTPSWPVEGVNHHVTPVLHLESASFHLPQRSFTRRSESIKRANSISLRPLHWTGTLANQ